MRLLNTFTKTLLITLAIFVGIQSRSYADGGFPTRPGRLLLSPSVSYFFSGSEWDSTGVKKPFANGGRYSSISADLYAEYGISRRWAAVVSLPFVYNDYTQNVTPKTTTSSGLTDLETGIRYYLANIDFIYYFSLQGTAITPLYQNNASLGYGEEGGELKLAFSGTAPIGDLTSYFNASDGVRQYFGTDGPIQNRFNGTFGLSLDRDYTNTVSLTLSGINSWSDDKSFSPILETNKNFRFLELSAGYGHSFTPEISLFLSGGQFLTGRNTGDGTAISLAFIYRIDNK
jgi:hypothetical protein